MMYGLAMASPIYGNLRIKLLFYLIPRPLLQTGEGEKTY
jgi:hypothetical protein